MGVSYSLIQPGNILFDGKKIGIVYKCSCEKPKEDLYGTMSGLISKEIIYHKELLREKPTEPRKQLSKHEIPILLQNLTFEFVAYKQYKPATMAKEKVELTISIEMRLLPDALEPYINFIDKIGFYYLEDLNFTAKILEEMKLPTPPMEF